MTSEPSENITNYGTRLRRAADKCAFADWSAEKMIKSLIISNIQDEDLRLKFLQKERTLDQILDISRKKEDAVARSKAIDNKQRSPAVRKIGTGRNFNGPRKFEHKVEMKCNKCGHEKHFPSTECPAASRTCNYCKKKGHYASVCFKKQNIKVLDDFEGKSVIPNDDTNTDTDECNVSMIDVLSLRSKPSLMRIQTDGQQVVWQPDTGTQRNVWDEVQFRMFQQQCKKAIPLQTTDIKLFAYGSKVPLSVVGCFDAVLKAGDCETRAEIYVTKESSTHPLLSELSAKLLGLIKYNESFLVKHYNYRKQVNRVRKC